MSSVSATFGSSLAAIPAGARAVPARRSVIVCSSRPQKKATAHHKKTRPRKTQPWDIKRKPTVYKPLPPMPPDWTLVSSAAAEVADPEPAAEEASPPPPPESD